MFLNGCPAAEERKGREPMTPSRLRLVLLVAVVAMLMIFSVPSMAAPVFLDNYVSDFAAYDYNTAAYATGSYNYTGCGPTTGAMIMNYFQNHFGATGLMEAGGGLATAQTLHGAAYMRTGLDGALDGFGSVYNIEPAMEGYAASKGYDVDAMIHVSPGYTSPDPGWDAYGPFGTSWTNDADYFATDGTNWWIDDTKFYDFMSTRLLAGTPIFLTVDSDGDGGGDHWVPMVGVDVGTYYYYNTWDMTLQSASVAYIAEYTAGQGNWGISLARTITFEGGDGNGDGGVIPEPGTLVLFGSGLAALAASRKRSKKS